MAPDLPDLDSIGLRHGTDKASHHHDYLRFYERFLRDLRPSETLTLLEIGVHEGASVRTWEEYFPHGRIVGLDNSAETRQHASGRIEVVTADQSDIADLVRVAVARGPFDVVIDDGSHVWDHQLTALKYLYPFVKPGGFYILEDIDTSYGSYVEAFHGIGDISAAQYLLNFCGYLIGDAAIDIAREPDPFIRSYARKTEFVAFYRRTSIIRKKVGIG